MTTKSKPASPKKKPEIVGKRLLALVEAKASEKNLSDRKLAEDVLGISYVYWNSLQNGHRPISGLAKDKLQKLAAFLGIPVFHALVLADVLSATDLLVQDSIDDDLAASLAKMRADPYWRALIPNDAAWAQTPMESRVALVLMYEKVSNERLLRNANIGVVMMPGYASQ